MKHQTVPLKAIVELVNHLAETCGVLAEAGYDEASVRAQVASLIHGYGSPVLDVGTGACACMAVTLARRGHSVMAVDTSSSAVRMAQERATGKLSRRLQVRHVNATRLPFPDGSYRAVVAFDALCHTSDPAAVLAEMFRVCDGVVVITELNTAGREITCHRDGGFEKKLKLLWTE